MVKACSTEYNPLRHPKSWEVRLHEGVRVSGSGFTLQQILKQVLVSTGFGKQLRNELPLKGAGRERLGRSALELRGDKGTACRETIRTACRGQPLGRTIPRTILGFKFKEKQLITSGGLFQTRVLAIKGPGCGSKRWH